MVIFCSFFFMRIDELGWKFFGFKFGRKSMFFLYQSVKKC